MDLTVQPSFNLPSGLPSGSFEARWVDNNRVRIQGTVPASTNGSGTLEIDLSNLVDRSGNAICEGQEMVNTCVF